MALEILALICTCSVGRWLPMGIIIFFFAIYPTYYLDHFSFFTFGRWNSEALIHYSIFLLFVLLWALCLYFGLCPGVTYIYLLGFFSTINNFLGFFSTINNLLFHQWSLCVCVINQKEFLLLIIKKIKKSSLSLSTANLKIVNQWSLSTSKNYQISFLSLFFFVFFHFLFISSRSDHNFIPVYPKFIGKAKAVRNHSNLKNQSRFLKPYNPTIVCTARCFLPVEWFLKLKKSQNWVVQGFSGRTVRSSPSFKTLGLGDSTCHATQ